MMTVQDIINKTPNDEIVIGNFIMERFLSKKFNDIVDIVNSLPHINGDLQLKKDDNVKVTLFWLVVLMNDTSLTSILLDRGNCDVNTLGTYKSRKFFQATPLYVACALGRKYIKIITILLEECKADVNITDRDGYTPLMKTTICSLLNPQDAIEITNILIFYGANVNYAVEKSGGNTALHYALEYGNNNNNYEHAKYLISRGADPFNIKNSANANAVILFAIYLAKKHDEYLDDDDDECAEEFEAKKVILQGFVNELVKSRYFEDGDDHVETLFRLFGAAFYPFIVRYKKYFWLNAIDYRERRRKKVLNTSVADKRFSDIVGTDKCEFQTFDDLKLIESKIDCLIQSIFISQRILGPKHGLTIELLRELCLEYEEDKRRLLSQYIKEIDNSPTKRRRLK